MPGHKSFSLDQDSHARQGLEHHFNAKVTSQRMPFSDPNTRTIIHLIYRSFFLCLDNKRQAMAG